MRRRERSNQRFHLSPRLTAVYHEKRIDGGSAKKSNQKGCANKTEAPEQLLEDTPEVFIRYWDKFDG